MMHQAPENCDLLSCEGRMSTTLHKSLPNDVVLQHTGVISLKLTVLLVYRSLKLCGINIHFVFSEVVSSSLMNFWNCFTAVTWVL